MGRRRRYVCLSLHAICDDNAAFAYGMKPLKLTVSVIVIAAVIAVIGTMRQWSESIIGALMTGVAALVFSLNDRVEARKSRRHDKTE